MRSPARPAGYWKILIDVLVAVGVVVEVGVLVGVAVRVAVLAVAGPVVAVGSTWTTVLVPQAATSALRPASRRKARRLKRRGLPEAVIEQDAL